jgi:hypothetical protein
MTATVVKNPDGSRYPNGPSDIESFAFTAVDVYGLTFAKPPPANNQVADGSTPDQGQAVVTDNGGALKSPVIVKFEFASSTSAKFVVTGDDNIQRFDRNHPLCADALRFKSRQEHCQCLLHRHHG